MATTTKTLTPTNQTVTLPDMTERPNASVLVDGIGKEADAINALSEQIAPTRVYPTTDSTYFNLGYSNCYNITKDFVHILVRAKVLAVPSSSDPVFITLPNGMTMSEAGLVIPVYKSSGEWSSPNSIIYGYVNGTNITIHSSEIAVNNFILIDFVSKLRLN